MGNDNDEIMVYLRDFLKSRAHKHPEMKVLVTKKMFDFIVSHVRESQAVPDQYMRAVFDAVKDWEDKHDRRHGEVFTSFEDLRNRLKGSN